MLSSWLGCPSYGAGMSLSCLMKESNQELDNVLSKGNTQHHINPTTDIQPHHSNSREEEILEPPFLSTPPLPSPLSLLFTIDKPKHFHLKCFVTRYENAESTALMMHKGLYLHFIYEAKPCSSLMMHKGLYLHFTEAKPCSYSN